MSDRHEKLERAADFARRAESDGLAGAITDAVVDRNPELEPLQDVAEPVVRRLLSRFWAWLRG